MFSRITRLTSRIAAYACAMGAAAVCTMAGSAQPAVQLPIRSDAGGILPKDGLLFRDLNRNGLLDPYEDWRLSPEERANDLVGRMTIEEKAGTMMHGTAPSTGRPPVPGAGTQLDFDKLEKLITEANVTSFITRLSGDPAELAKQFNRAQALAEQTRLGIPLTISSDPRSGFQYQPGASVAAGVFSQWPELTGLAAVGDPSLVRRHAEIARQEYLAVGIRMALSPQADLATEPRWARVKGTFGEDPEKARAFVRAYVQGFQGDDGTGKDSVAAIVKHWVGYGAAVDGYDAHNHYGKLTELSPASLEMHIIPFKGAFEANVAGVMPTYSVPPKGLRVQGVKDELEQVGAGFSKQMLTELLRGRFGYGGMILTDWAIMEDCNDVCRHGAPSGSRATPADIAMPWGVETLPKSERYLKALDAGVDQFGGIEEPSTLIALTKAGRVPQARLDTSVMRILVLKFRQGLFENPYVDVKQAAKVVGNPGFVAEALAAQARSLVMLENRKDILPLRPQGRKVFLYQVDAKAAEQAGFVVVNDVKDADLAIIRATAPFERRHANYFFGARYNEGNLAFLDGNPEYEAIKLASSRVPTIVTVYLDRPAVLTNVKDKAAAMLANFGVSDEALFQVLTGKRAPEGKLPFELPSSMAEVERQRPDLPHDTQHPLYRIGYGLHYPQ